MGNADSVKKVCFEDIQFILKNNTSFNIITTLQRNEQGCLIKKTIPAHDEEYIVNQNIKNPNFKIIIYGKNTNDETIYKKYKQLLSIGLSNIFIYPGGLFEWLCLQDIYGDVEFPTTSKELDILKFKPRNLLRYNH